MASLGLDNQRVCTPGANGLEQNGVGEPNSSGNGAHTAETEEEASGILGGGGNEYYRLLAQP